MDHQWIYIFRWWFCRIEFPIAIKHCLFTMWWCLITQPHISVILSHRPTALLVFYILFKSQVHYNMITIMKNLISYLSLAFPVVARYAYWVIAIKVINDIMWPSHCYLGDIMWWNNWPCDQVPGVWVISWRDLYFIIDTGNAIVIGIIICGLLLAYKNQGRVRLFFLEFPWITEVLWIIMT